MKTKTKPKEDMQRTLSGYEFEVVNVSYELTDVSDGYQCGCGGDDHDQFADLHGCECFCHGVD